MRRNKFIPKVYPPVNDSMADLLKPLGQKENRGNVWIPIVSQIMNVQKGSTPPPPVETYNILTQSLNNITTLTGDKLKWQI